MKRLFVALVVMGILSITSIAMAGSIAPVLNVLPVAGEAEFSAFFPLGATDQAYVDWIVFNPGAYGQTAFSSLISDITGNSTLSQYLYIYQIEARGSTALSNIENLTIYFKTSMASAAGSYSADLDLWHNVGLFANLAGEGEIDGATLEPLHFGPAWSSNNLTWDYDGYLNGVDGGGNPTGTQESEIAWFTSPSNPGYAPAALNDTAQTGGTLPAPTTPEPTTMVLTGIGLLGVVGRLVKKFRA